MVKVKSFFRKRYFDKSFPMEYRVYMIFFFECFFISLLSAITNTLLGKGFAGVIFQWVFVLVCIIVAFISSELRMRISKGMILFLIFIYIPFLFFQTAGYDGTAFTFSLLGLFAIAIVFKGVPRLLMIIGTVAVCVVCCLLQYLYPELVTPHDGAQANLIDYIVALVLASIGLAIMTIYISNVFVYEESIIRKLLSDVELSNKKLAELSNRDALTGAYNRRFLNEFMERTIESCNASEKSVYFMLMDLDKFKSINDTYGHGFGDEVLKATVRAIGAVLRESDILARYGGEEFAVVVYGTDDACARDIASRICEALRQVEFRNGVKVTISVGCIKSSAGETQEEIFERADKQLYRAKSEGRNRVCFELSHKDSED